MPTNANTMLQLARTLSQPAQVQEPQNFDGQIGQINRDYGLADALAQQQYIPNSGWLGALAQAVSGLGSYYVGKRADKAAGEVGAKVEAQRQAQEAARAEAEARKQAEQYAREDAREQAKAAAAMARVQAQEDARNRRQAEKLAAEAAKGRGGGVAKPSSPFGKELQAAVDAGLVKPEEAAALARAKFGLDKPPNSGQRPLSAKDAVAAQTRAASGQSLLGSIDAAERMLDEGEVNTGPIMGRLTAGWTEGAQKYQAEIGGILAELRRLQKTPGSGADSDKELDILVKQVPSMITTEAAAKEILGRLREKARAYGAGAGPMQIIPNSSAAQQSGWSIEEVQ